MMMTVIVTVRDRRRLQADLGRRPAELALQPAAEKGQRHKKFGTTRKPRQLQGSGAMRDQTVAVINISKTTGAQAPLARTGQVFCQLTPPSHQAHHTAQGNRDNKILPSRPKSVKSTIVTSMHERKDGRTEANLPDTIGEKERFVNALQTCLAAGRRPARLYEPPLICPL